MATEPGFRHQIGDALYDLFTYEQPLRSGGNCDETVMYPLVRRTERYIYALRWPWLPESVMRFSRETLERDGKAWNGRWRIQAHTRPMPHWPTLLIETHRTDLLEQA